MSKCPRAIGVKSDLVAPVKFFLSRDTEGRRTLSSKPGTLEISTIKQEIPASERIIDNNDRIGKQNK